MEGALAPSSSIECVLLPPGTDWHHLFPGETVLGILESEHKGLNPAFTTSKLYRFGQFLLSEPGFPLLMMEINVLTGVCVYVCVC